MVFFAATCSGYTTALRVLYLQFRVKLFYNFINKKWMMRPKLTSYGAFARPSCS